jgi:hypothetical protein
MLPAKILRKVKLRRAFENQREFDWRRKQGNTAGCTISLRGCEASFLSTEHHGYGQQ